MSWALSPYTVTVIALEVSGGMLWNWSPETITAIATATIAISALWTSIRESRRMQKHNQLSVRPLLDIDERHHYGDGKSQMRFKIKNVGVGPAILTRFAVFFDDKEFVLPGEKDKLKKEIQLAMLYPHILGTGYALNIAAGASHDLLTLEIDGSETEARTLAKCVGFDIEYQSIYQNEKFSRQICNSSGYPEDKSPTRENQKG